MDTLVMKYIMQEKQQIFISNDSFQHVLSIYLYDEWHSHIIHN